MVEAQLKDHLLYDVMMDIGQKAKNASRIIANASTESKNNALLAAASFLEENTDHIIAENAKDIKNAHAKQLSESMIDRLRLDAKKVGAIAEALRDIAKLDDPVGKNLATWDRPNGLNISRIATPIGVLGIIYESRPNVTADAAALSLKSGNVCILRGGTESLFSSRAIHNCLVKGLTSANLPVDAIQMISVADREAVGIMLSGMASFIDMIIPRGGKSLVARVQAEARVPVLAHLEGLCHSYIHEEADFDMAESIVLNAKMRRTGVCGATETLLIDKNFGHENIRKILFRLQQEGCTVRGCDKARLIFPEAQPATEQDWCTEYLAPIISVKITQDFNEAVMHIQHYSSNHTDAIITDNSEIAEKFLLIIDSAIVLHNASTQFADGGEFGMGAEIGIATGKIHARGPVGLEQLCCFKYQLRGNGQIRPL